MKFLWYVCCFLFLISCQDTSFFPEDTVAGESKDDGRDEIEEPEDNFANCDAEGMLHGQRDEDLIFYEKESVPYGDVCEKYLVDRLCHDGNIIYLHNDVELEGIDQLFDACSVEPQVLPLDCGELAHGQSESRIQFRESSVAFGGKCESEEQTRSCQNGNLTDWSGSFENSTCKISDPSSCGDVAHGNSESRVRYKNSSVAFGGSCESEKQARLCQNGSFSSWSGSFKHETCSVEGPKSCGDLAHGSSESRVRFKNSSVAHGESCESEKQERSCNNGILSAWSGSYVNEKCNIDDPKNCGDLAHGDSESRIRYKESIVAHGRKCESEKQERSCSNGILSSWSGSYSNLTCDVDGPKSCGDLANGASESRVRYKSSLVGFGEKCESEKQERICNNGSFSEWSGSFIHESCEVGKAKSCGDVSHGASESRIKFRSSSVAFGGKCESEKQTRVCKNGDFSAWSGSFKYDECSVDGAKDCGSLAHGASESRVKFKLAEVEFGGSCESEKQERKCHDGELSSWSGSYLHNECSILPEPVCEEGDIKRRRRFRHRKVAWNKKCVSQRQVKKCVDGQWSKWSGKFRHRKCEVAEKPKDCGDVKHGEYESRKKYEKALAYLIDGERCHAEIQKRRCINGSFGDWSGSFSEDACKLIRPKNCEYLGSIIAHGKSVKRIRFAESSVASGEVCEQEEQIGICDDGIIKFDGSYEHDKCVVDGEECEKGKVLTISIDKDGDGIADTEPVEIISYKGQFKAADNYNYFSWSAHPHIGPSPQGYKSHAYLYEGPDGLSFQFYYNKDKMAGEDYDGSPNSVVNWDIETYGNNFDDGIFLSDDGRELKDKGEIANSHKLYEGRFHYWYNTDGGVIGPFNGEDFKILVKPIESYELYKDENGEFQRRDAFNGATFFSADGTKVKLDDQDGNVHSYIIEFKEEKSCDEYQEEESFKVGCADGYREGFKDLEKFPHIAGCAGGFENEGVLPKHRVRDESCKGIGNNSDNFNGDGCGIQNICAEGWEVVPTVSVLGEFTDGKYCHSIESDELTENIAFVTGVTSWGWSKVYDKDEDLLNAILNYEEERENYIATKEKNYKKHVNDLFYCGGQKVAAKPFNNALNYFSSFSHNVCSGARGFASCNSVGGFFEADRYSQVLNGAGSTRGLASENINGGGVVCVKSSEVDKLDIDDDLRPEDDYECIDKNHHQKIKFSCSILKSNKSKENFLNKIPKSFRAFYLEENGHELEKACGKEKTIYIKNSYDFKNKEYSTQLYNFNFEVKLSKCNSSESIDLSEEDEVVSDSDVLGSTKAIFLCFGGLKDVCHRDLNSIAIPKEYLPIKGELLKRCKFSNTVAIDTKYKNGKIVERILTSIEDPRLKLCK